MNTSGRPVAGLIDRVLDAVIVAIATWTLAYHLALIADLRKVHAVAIFAVLVVATVAFAILRTRSRREDPPEADRVAADQTSRVPWPLVVLLAAAGTTVVFALRDAVTAFSVLAVATAAAALVWSIRMRGDTRTAASSPSLLEVVAVVLMAVAFAGLTTIDHSPTGDDTYYVNRAMYVEANDGPFPTKDTIFADQRYPSVTPPDTIASYEAFVGTIGWATGVDARTVYYLLFAPLFAALGVFSIWRFARSAGSRSAVLVLAVAIGYVLLAGRPGRFGSIAVHRIYEGKAVLVWFLIPWLWHHANAYAKTASRRSLLWMFVGGIAAVGLSSSGAFLTPLVILAATAPLLVERGREVVSRVRPFLLGLTAALYPALATLAGALSLSVYSSVESAERRVKGSIDVWMHVLGPGRELFLTATAALVAWVLIRDRRLRIGLGFAVLGIVLAITPAGLAVFDLLGLKQISPRLWWVIPLPVVIGLAVDATLGWGRTFGKVACVSALVACAILLSEEARRPQSVLNATYTRPSWNVDHAEFRSATRLVRLARSHSVVAAPVKISALVSNVDPTVHAVNPRAGYTSRLSAAIGRSFRGDDRFALTEALAGEPTARRVVARALRTLEVKAVCAVAPVLPAVEDALEDEGFRSAGEDARCTYWKT